MTYRFAKKMYNAEDGTRMLRFFDREDPSCVYATYDLNTLEDQRNTMGDLQFAVVMVKSLQEMMGIVLTPEEIEFAVEDI